MTGIIDHFPASKYALLGFLFDGPSHGYEIHKHMTDPEGIGMVWEVKMSNLYAQLSKLEQTGFIQGRLMPQEQRPSRKEYSLTDAGRLEFTNWLHQVIHHPRHFRQEFMVQYFFLQQYEPQSLRTQIQSQLKECQRWVEGIRGKELSSSTYANALFHFRISQVHSMIDWLNWLLGQNNYHPNER